MELLEEVGILMLRSWPEVCGWAWDVVVLMLVRMLMLVVMLVGVVGALQVPQVSVKHTIL